MGYPLSSLSGQSEGQRTIRGPLAGDGAMAPLLVELDARKLPVNGSSDHWRLVSPILVDHDPADVVAVERRGHGVSLRERRPSGDVDRARRTLEIRRGRLGTKVVVLQAETNNAGPGIVGALKDVRIAPVIVRDFHARLS